MKRNNLIVILGGMLAVLVLVFADLRAPTSTAATVLAARLSADDLSALTSDSGDAPCYPGTGAADPPSVYPARAFLPLVVAPPSTPTCAIEVEPNDTHRMAQVVTATCVQAKAADSGEADWYALRLCSPVALTLRTQGAPTGTLDLDLSLHGDSPGVPIISSEGPDSSKLVLARLIAGTYYVRVQPAAGSGAYELSITTRR